MPIPAQSETNITRIVQSVRELWQGRSNAVGTCTLTAAATSTVVPAVNCGERAAIKLTPLTANAAAAVGSTYVSSRTNGAFTLTHANNAQTDRQFSYAIQG